MINRGRDTIFLSRTQLAMPGRRDRVDFKAMKQFLAVAEALSFRKAAEKLHVSQPPLSVAIKQLELQLGVALFERRSTGVALTRAGLTYQRECLRLVALAEQAVTKTRTVGLGGAGEVRVGFISSAMIEFLPKVLVACKESFPQLQLKLVEAISVDVANMVDLGQVDVGLLSPPVPLSSIALREPVLSDILVAVLPSTHALGNLPEIALSALAGEDFVSFSAARVPAFHQRIVAACQEQGFEPNIVQEATQIYTILSLVAAGMGVALLPSATARLEHPGVKHIPIVNRSALLQSRIEAAYLAGPLEPAVASFLSIVRATAKR